MKPSDSKTSARKKVDYSNVIDKVFALTNEHLLILMNHMINIADQKFAEMAEGVENAEEDSKQDAYTNIIKADKNDAYRLFFLNLNKSLAITKKNPNLAEEQPSTLVPHDEMEEMVAITTMHAKAMNIYGKEVNDLQARLEFLEIMCDDIFDKEALDPKHICLIFQKTIENLNISIDEKLIFYKLFDEEVCSKLGVMYKALNQIFIRHGIMPEIILDTTDPVELEQPQDVTHVATYYDPTENVADNFIPRTQEDISRIVNEFMSGDMTITGDELELPASFLRAPTQKDLDGKDCYQRKEVIKALSHLQKRIMSLHDIKDLSSEQIKKEVLEDIRKENVSADNMDVNLLDERNIDFVGMMFNAITDDETVSEIMKNLIQQLQVPIIKVSMSDASLFKEDYHPARVTVDLLTKAGKGINNQEEDLYKKLEGIVNNILKEFDTDIKTFDKAVDALNEIIYREEQLAKETERKQKIKIIQEHAKHIVITQIKMASTNRKIPGILRPLILKHWATLMLNRYIRYGRNSYESALSVLMLKLLLKCIQPIRFQSQLNMVKDNQQALVEAMSDELHQTKQDKNDIDSQIDTLKSHLTKIIADGNLAIINKKNLDDEHLFKEETERTQEELRKALQQEELVKQKIDLLAEYKVETGDWYEVYNGEDKAVRRLRLSVIMKDEARLIFVNHKGVKVIEKDAEVFTKELKDNRSRILVEHSTFDNAFGQVINALAGPG